MDCAVIQNQPREYVECLLFRAVFPVSYRCQR